MKRWGCCGVWALAVLFLQGVAHAEWVRLPGAFKEREAVDLAVDMRDPKRIIAAFKTAVYRTEDGGLHWKKILILRGARNAVRVILVPTDRAGVIWVASEQRLQVSIDDGKKWTRVVLPGHRQGRSVTALESDAKRKAAVWVGAEDGLYRVSAEGQAERIHSFDGSSVEAIHAEAGQIWVACDKGLYVSRDEAKTWTRTHAVTRPETIETDDVLSQFSIEELGRGAGYSNFIFFKPDGRLYIGSREGLYRTSPDAVRWERVLSGKAAAAGIADLAPSGEGLFLGTPKGVVEVDGTGREKDRSEGLASRDVRRILFHGSSGDLYAATDEGFYRYPKPGYAAVEVRSVQTVPSPEEWLRRFENEPSILEVQQAAIRYAEVHPDKIQDWRRRAASRAWFPTVSLSADRSEDENIDLDRGGTNDPDRFIMGPTEEGTDLRVGVSWDLADLVWNGDQTSIDTRSKLMAELREDVLEEVTHLYFERRRLQAEEAMHPAADLPVGVERRLKLEELTAGIDAFTGGYFSKRIKEMS